MEIAYTPNAQKDLEWWKANGSEATKKRFPLCFVRWKFIHELELESQKSLLETMQVVGLEESTKKIALFTKSMMS